MELSRTLPLVAWRGVRRVLAICSFCATPLSVAALGPVPASPAQCPHAQAPSTDVNRVLDAIEGQRSNAPCAARAPCSADTALRDIKGLLALGVLGKLEGGGCYAGYALRFSAA